MVAQPPDEGLPRRREPWLYGAIGGLVVLVLVLAIAVIALLGGSNEVPVAATASPAPSLAGSPGAIALPSASPAPTETTATTPSPEPTAEPTGTPMPTAEPTPTVKPTPTTRPTPTPATNPAIITYGVPAIEDCTDDTAGSIHVTWSVIRATGVTISIDGPGIYDSYPGTSGSVDIPFGCSTEVDHHTYTLRTTGGTGPAATATKTVKVAAPKIVSFTLPDEAVCPNGSSLPIDFGYAIQYATGVSLTWDRGSGPEVYGTYNGKTSTNGLQVTFDCQYESIVYVLTTTGGYGNPATSQVTVDRVFQGPTGP